MYLSFYGLHEKPFSLTPDTKFLYLSKNHRDALNHLIYGIIEKEGFVVLTGDIGTGKTTIVRALLERLGEHATSALIINPILEGKELLRSILEEFGINNTQGTRKELIDRLNQFLLGELVQRRDAVLIIDEAQHLSDQALEHIRLLSNLETEKAKLIQIILVGQVELHLKLESPLLRPLNQRVSIRHHLAPLDLTDTEKYIHHRLLVAGSNGHITLSTGAINEIFKYSQGIPRLINLFCDRTLLTGYVRQRSHIDKRIVKKGAESLEKHRVPSNTHCKNKGLYFLVVLALFLECIYFTGLHGKRLYSTSSRFAHLVWECLAADPPSGPGLSSIERTAAATAIAKTEFTSTPGHEDTCSSEAMEAKRSGHPYSIHIGSYRESERAFSNVDHLRKSGYQANVIEVDIPGKGILHRVMCGKFQTKGDAQETLEKIKTVEGFSDARITRFKEDDG